MQSDKKRKEQGSPRAEPRRSTEEGGRLKGDRHVRVIESPAITLRRSRDKRETGR